MGKIGLLSDTHGYWDEKYVNYFSSCDEIWHAGDIGSLSLAEQFEAFKPFRAVCGNIDDSRTRSRYKMTERFIYEDTDILLTHIGGYPDKYSPSILPTLKENPPQLFICGHSHILKVMYDPKFKCLHINPGAAGKYGFHQVRTLIRFDINKGHISNLEVIELKK